jgi:murein L,D-transpeptidase YcbB/YkuD
LTRRTALRALAGAVALPWISTGALAQTGGRDPLLSVAAGERGLVTRGTEADLAQAIGAYERVVGAGGWPVIPGPRLSPAMDDPRVALLQQRLMLSGDLGPASGVSTLYTPSVREAVMRFQARHGLAANGTVSGLTLAHLNVPAGERLRQMRVNLGRLRAALGRMGGGPTVIVNAPAFELQGVVGDRVEIVSRVIVGTRDTQTPEVSAQVRALDILPFWHVPEGVARRALIPNVQKDPTYFFKQKIRVFSSFGGAEVDPASVNWFGPEATRYVFRQDPGPHNALGVLRLDMPNRHIVYMHDTPMKNLFGYTERAMSAGCVRVQQVLDVGAWIANGQDGWTRATIDQLVAAGNRTTLTLARPVPVHFVYITAWAQGGVVQFRNDLYSRDDSAAVPGSDDPSMRAPFAAVAP